DGELGTNDLAARLVPTSIGNKTDWSAVAIGRYITCATDTAGALWCWGESNTMVPTMIDPGPGWTDPEGSPELEAERCTALKNGAIEIVDTFNIVPPVTTFTDWTLFDVAAEHGCGLRGGTMFCQGSADVFGELGDNGMQPDPQQGWQVSSATDWI